MKKYIIYRPEYDVQPTPAELACLDQFAMDGILGSSSAAHSPLIQDGEVVSELALRDEDDYYYLCADTENILAFADQGCYIREVVSSSEISNRSSKLLDNEIHYYALRGNRTVFGPRELLTKDVVERLISEGAIVHEEYIEVCQEILDTYMLDALSWSFKGTDYNNPASEIERLSGVLTALDAAC